MTKPKKKLKRWPLLETRPVAPGATIEEVIQLSQGKPQLPIRFPHA